MVYIFMQIVFNECVLLCALRVTKRLEDFATYFDYLWSPFKRMSTAQKAGASFLGSELLCLAVDL